MPNKRKKNIKSNGTTPVEITRKSSEATIDETPLETKTNINDHSGYINEYFTTNEQKHAKQILRVKDLENIPLQVIATVLNKLETITTIVERDGTKTEIDKSALIWAVKLKHIDMIDALLTNFTIHEVHTNEHVLYTALENKFWEEPIFLKLWSLVKHMQHVDLNLVNRHGLSMLHLAVRREWTKFMEILILDKADVNISNQHGLTPLMLASYRNNLEIVSHLLNSGANVIQPDYHGFISLCYAFCSVISKNAKPPFSVVDRIIIELEKCKVSLYDYLKERINMIGDPYLNKSVSRTQPNPELLLSNIIIFVTSHVNEGSKLLFCEYKLVKCLTNAAKSHFENTEVLKTILSVVNSLVKHFSKDEDLGKFIVNQYIANELLELCVDIFNRHKSSKFSIAVLAWSPIIFCSIGSKNGEKWLESKITIIHKLFEEICKRIKSEKTDDLNFYFYFDISADKIELFEKKINLLVSENKKGIEDSQKVFEGVDKKFNAKKVKRRTKAMKAKIAKIKSAELTMRLNGKKISETKPNVSVKDPHEEESINEGNMELKELYFRNAPSDDCEIVTGIKTKMKILEQNIDYENLFIQIFENKANDVEEEQLIDWKQKIRELPFRSNTTTFDVYKNGVLYDNRAMRKLFSNLFSSNLNGGKELLPVFTYLTDLMHRITRQYQKYWTIDKEIEYEAYRHKSTGTSISRDKSGNKKHINILHDIENEKLLGLDQEFQSLIGSLEKLADTDLQQTYSILKQLEKLLLNHEIREKSILEDIIPMENVILNVSMPDNYFIPGLDDSESTFAKYVEQVLEGEREELEDIKISLVSTYNENFEDTLLDDFTYLNEEHQREKDLETLLDLDEDNEENVDVAGDYPTHLLTSILSLVDCPNEDQNESQCSSKQDTKSSDEEDSDGTSELNNCQAFCCKSSITINKPTNRDREQQQKRLTTTRWCSLVRSLDMMDNCQSYFAGQIRISCQEKRQSHVISTGGNFTPVELGLGKNTPSGTPLAVKRVPRGSCVCKMLKNMVDPLVHLEHKHLLPYYLCDFSESELIWATPLCEYNVGQYVMLMKNSPTKVACTRTIVGQFLSGLRFLHDGLKEPVVHGNLKPSNIFVDQAGTVKIAEFGIHKALFKFKEAASSSIIWFSTETFRIFRELSIMECSLASDIQVAGMLIYFIMTAGQHPFGNEMRTILKNLEKAVPKLTTHDMELEDLIAWMLLSEPSDRPSIQQVLSHVFFWSPKRKWRFILTCSGLTTSQKNYPIILEDLHESLDRISTKENIKGNWVSIMKSKYSVSSAMNNDDTPTGLLRFIKSRINSADCDITDDLKKQILESFPSFALSLYRMIETTPWMEHKIFKSFYANDV